MTPFDRAVKLLAARQRTARELDAALARAKVAPEDRKEALARLAELGYLDDREVARSRARTLLARGTAPRLAARKLAAQGVSPQDARTAAEEAAEGADELALAKAALQKRLRGRSAGTDEKRRLFRHLVAKGHRAGAVAKALGLEWEGDDPQDDD